MGKQWNIVEIDSDGPDEQFEMVSDAPDQWTMVEMDFLLKWIHVTGHNVLYVINEEDSKPYRINMENREYHLIHDSNDFEQIIYDNDSQRVWAVNYYQQLFYLNEEGTDWVYVDEGIKHISIGHLPVQAELKQDL